MIRVAQQSLAVAAGGAWIAVGLVQKSQGQFSVMEPGTGLDDPAVGARRWTLAPTVFYGYSLDRAWNDMLRGWGQAASEITTCSDDFWALVEEAELDWVYLRVGVGSLQPGGLAGCEGVRELYEEGGGDLPIISAVGGELLPACSGKRDYNSLARYESGIRDHFNDF